MLLLSNPGIAKTTIVGEIAAHEGYEVVSLIGSGFENNEILGFQVNEPDWDYLITKNPTWFNTILENKKNNKPSILFIDEISVCPSLVQGALYRLIFERTIGNGRKLPEDCVIISAGNYKSNLPSYCDITAPALNRFCMPSSVSSILNLLTFTLSLMSSVRMKKNEWQIGLSSITMQIVLVQIFGTMQQKKLRQ